jgi:hypothetical protein
MVKPAKPASNRTTTFQLLEAATFVAAFSLRAHGRASVGKFLAPRDGQ